MDTTTKYLTAWNTPMYSDGKLELQSNDTRISKSIYISLFALSKESEFFNDKFKDHSRNDPLVIRLRNSEEVYYFEVIIRIIYKEPLKILEPDHLINIILLADSYKVSKVVKIAVKKLLELPFTMELSKLYLEKLSNIKSYDRLRQKLLNPACEILINTFKDIRGVFTGLMDDKKERKKKDEFIDLPPYAIIGWLKSDNLIVDSENSVFYFTMLWLLKDEKKAERSDYFPEIIEHIRFIHMRIHYLLDIIPRVYDQLQNPEYVKLLREKRQEALNYHSLPDRSKHMRSKSSVYPPVRVLLPDTDKVMIKCIFQEVSKWEPTGKYYSSPVLINGYEFYFFLQRQLVSKPNDNEVYGMAGFLRCSGSLIPSQHYLPISYSVAIQTPSLENRERKFSTMRVIFEAPEKAIGGKLTLQDETWDQVIRGESPIVYQNTITVIVSIEFLNDDRDCLSMQEEGSERNVSRMV